MQGKLKEAGIRPSYYRMLVLGYLLSKKTHPTADEVFSSLAKDLPTLSKTTVYNTLNLLVDSGLAIAISIEGHETRYDATTKYHGHFKCKKCGAIYDFELDPNQEFWMGLEGFRIDEKEVNFKGICYNCRKEEKNQKPGGRHNHGE